MVFRYPEDPSLDYIKRVVGLPGDKVAYQNKRLTINGEPVERPRLRTICIRNGSTIRKQFVEKLGDVEHRILNDADAPAFIPDARSSPTAKIAPTIMPA
jgi:signal peptidase I